MRCNAGAYTVMRTTQNRQRLLCFEHHLQRLSTSAMAIGADRTRVEPGRLERDVLHAIRSAMSAGGDGDDELNVAVVVDMSGEVAVHLSILKERETGACVVVEAMRGSRAKYGSTKDSKWVVERQGLLDRRTAPEADDVVLVNDEGAVLEGLSSNFFVIGADQVVQTVGISRVVDGSNGSRGAAGSSSGWRPGGFHQGNRHARLPSA